MNPALAELLHGAGLSDIVIPRSKFIKEHKHLVKLLSDSNDPALQKEAKDQSEELQALTGGTHRENVLRQWKLEDKPYNLKQLSDITSIPISILQEVYNRGIGAYSTSPTSVRLKGSFVKNVDAPMSKKLSKENWAMARVYSFIDGNEKHDNDLRRNKGGFFNLNAFRSMPSGTKAILSSAVKPVMDSLVPALGKVAEHIIPLLGKGIGSKKSISEGTAYPMEGGKLTRASGFIKRLMAENALKHQGQYKNPTWELHPRSTMSQPWEFKYKKLANPDQNGENVYEDGTPKEYGASPFIQKHFGQARAVPFERKRGVAPPLEPYKSKRKSKKITQESEEQKKARRSFVQQEAEAQPEQEANEAEEHSAPVRDDDADEKEREKEERGTKIDPRASSQASNVLAELPEGIFPIDKTNNAIQKLMIDNPLSLKYSQLTPKGQRMLTKLYESIRFHVQNDENVEQLPDRMSHYGYADLEQWARENYGNEMKQDDNWLMKLMYGDWNGRWRMLSDDEQMKRGERKQKGWLEDRKKEFARQEEAQRKLAPSFHAKAKK